MTPPNRYRLHLAWLTRLRWLALVIGAVLILGGEVLLAGALPVAALLSLLLAQAALQAVALRGLAWMDRRFTPADWDRHGPQALTASLVADVLLLVAVLSLAGGADNPFVIVLLVHVALAAVVLTPRASFGLASFAVLLHAGLVLWAPPLPSATPVGDDPARGLVLCGPDGEVILPAAAPAAARPSGRDPGAAERAVQQGGNIVAFAGAVALLISFIGRMRRALDRRDEELARERELRGRAERVQSMATLAAGAAHELASPLSTIAVVSGDLRARWQRANADDAESLEDLDLIRRELDACRVVLDEMAFGAGEVRAGARQRIDVTALLREVATLPDAAPAQVRVEAATALHARVDEAGLRRSLRNLVRNARDAGASQVTIHATNERRGEQPGVRVDVVDDGRGMDPATLARADEPFFTTRATGERMGLGLHLVRRFIEASEGELAISSTPGQGTRATLWWPCGPEFPSETPT